MATKLAKDIVSKFLRSLMKKNKKSSTMNKFSLITYYGINMDDDYSSRTSSKVSFNEDDDIDDIEKKKHFVGLGRKKKTEDFKTGFMFGKKAAKQKVATANFKETKEDSVVELDHTQNLALME